MSKKISELVEKTTITGDEYLVIATDNENYKIKADIINDVIDHPVDAALSATSENPVQNKVIYDALQSLSGDLGGFIESGVSNIAIASVSTETTAAGTEAAVTVSDLGVENTVKSLAFAFSIPRGADGQDGKDGVDGKDGKDGADGSTVGGEAYRLVVAFKTSATKPDTPTGGSWDVENNVITLPDGWSNDDDTLSSPVWMSTGTFCSTSPDDPEWTAPVKISGENSEAGVSYRTAIAYTSSESRPSAPTGGSWDVETNTITYPTGWVNDDDTLTAPIWMSTGDFRSDYPNDPEWSAPVMIQGVGSESAGEDVATVEYIYRQTASSDDVPSITLTDSPNTDGYEPANWTDSPLGITPTLRCEWFCLREKTDGVWGNWEGPYIWSHWGEKGQDGDGVEYIYLLNSGASVSNPTPDDYLTNTSYQAREWTTSNTDGTWTDQPTGVTAYDTHEWVCQRKYTEGVWQACSEPALWAKYGKDGAAGDSGSDTATTEFIYTRTENKDTTPEIDVTDSPAEDDYEPDGWDDRPSGITESLRCEWFCYRDKEGDTWLNWNGPFIWSCWGENGKDGDGVEYIYYLNTVESAPSNPTPSNWASNTLYQTAEWPESDSSYTGNWTDNPTGVSADAKYEYVCKRRQLDGIWQPFSDAALWAKYGEDGVGSQGVSGLPGVSILLRYCLGTEDTYQGSSSPSGYSPTGWSSTIPTVTDALPYIWCIQGQEIWTSETEVYYVWEDPFRLSGLNGLATTETGADAKIIYPAGVYVSTKTYESTLESAPYVLDTSTGKYYILSPTPGSTFTWTGTSQSNTLPSESDSWREMEMFQAIYSDIGAFGTALVGSAVFWEEFMFSQQDVDGGNDYQNFNPDDPYDSSNSFIPAWCVNLKTGEMWSGGGAVHFASDGSGYVANGGIAWAADGSITSYPKQRIVTGTTLAYAVDTSLTGAGNYPTVTAVAEFSNISSADNVGFLVQDYSGDTITTSIVENITGTGQITQTIDHPDDGSWSAPCKVTTYVNNAVVSATDVIFRTNVITALPTTYTITFNIVNPLLVNGIYMHSTSQRTVESENAYFCLQSDSGDVYDTWSDDTGLLVNTGMPDETTRLFAGDTVYIYINGTHTKYVTSFILEESDMTITVTGTSSIS